MATLDDIERDGRTLWLDAECIHDGALSYLEVLGEVHELVEDAFGFTAVDVPDPGEFRVVFEVDGESRHLVLEDARDWLDPGFFGGLNQMLRGERRLWVLQSGGQELLLAWATPAEAEAMTAEGVALQAPPEPVWGGAEAEQAAAAESARFLAALGARLGTDAPARLAQATGWVQAQLRAGDKVTLRDFGTFRRDRRKDLLFRPGHQLKQRIEGGPAAEPGPPRLEGVDGAVLQAMVAVVGELLTQPEAVARVPGLGVFRVVLSAGGRFRHPATGQMIDVPDRNVVRFTEAPAP